jgi:hypothetical protein
MQFCSPRAPTKTAPLSLLTSAVFAARIMEKVSAISGAYEFQEFAGDPGKANCMGRSMSAVSLQYHSLRAAAFALGFGNVRSLQNAIMAFCKG